MLPPTLADGVARRWRTLFSGGEAALIPQARLSGPMPWVIAIMVALTVIAAAAGLALRNAASVAEADLSGGITVQIVEASPEARARQAEAALAWLHNQPDLRDARLVPAREIEALIEPWLGAEAADADAVPIPAMIDARASGKVTPARLAKWQHELRGIAPAARIDAQSDWLKPVFDAIQSLQWLALALVALLGMAMAAAVVLAVRTALGNNRDTIEIVHLLGAADAQVAGVFQRSIGIDAAGGGAVGLLLAVMVIMFLGRRLGSLEAGLVAAGALSWFDWLLLVMVPVAGVVLAVVTARLTVMRTLRRML